MMKQLTLIIVVCLFAIPVAIGQNNKGVQFEEGLNWQQLKAKAKADNKYIFVDCYATWCGPCKVMDMTVYPNDKVGTALNDNFLSVKIQFDETPKDSEETKKWRETARALSHDYKIAGYPTYLFFSPEGKLMYQGMSATDPDGFIKMVDLAMTDPVGKLGIRLDNYKKGKKDYLILPELMKQVDASGDKELANLMLNDYKSNYLEKLNETELLSKDNLLFILEHPDVVSSKNKFFKLFSHRGNKIDTIIGDKGISERMVEYVITKEDIEDKLWKDSKPVTKKPDWKKISANIRKKYNAGYAESLVPAAKFRFYQRIGDWKEYARLKNDNIKKNPPKPGAGMDSDAWSLNSDAWNVFLRSSDAAVLSSALEWSELSIQLDASNEEPNVQLYDTKANLLYKLGRVEEAIACEEKAIALDQEIAKKQGREKGGFVDSYNKIIAKMKAGEPTWPVPGQHGKKP